MLIRMLATGQQHLQTFYPMWAWCRTKLLCKNKPDFQCITSCISSYNTFGELRSLLSEYGCELVNFIIWIPQINVRWLVINLFLPIFTILIQLLTLIGHLLASYRKWKGLARPCTVLEVVLQISQHHLRSFQVTCIISNDNQMAVLPVLILYCPIQLLQLTSHYKTVTPAKLFSNKELRVHGELCCWDNFGHLNDICVNLLQLRQLWYITRSSSFWKSTNCNTQRRWRQFSISV